MAAAQPKPDSSYASNRITKSNPPPKHLLSNFNEPELEDAKIDIASMNKEAIEHSVETQPEIDTDAEPLSSDEEEPEDSKPDVAQPSIEKRLEIDTDAEPLSSDEEEDEDSLPDIAQPSIENKPEIDTDTESLSSVPLSSYEEEAEDPKSNAIRSSIKNLPEIDTDADPLSSDVEQTSDSDASPRRKEVNYTTTTLEEKLAEANRAYGSSQSHNGYSRKGSFARTASAMTGSGDEDGPLFSSQSHKRHKAVKYVSKSYFNRPHFAPGKKPTTKAKEPSPVEEAPKEPEETFIMPKDIENSSFREPRGGEDSNSSFSHGQTIEEYEAMLLDNDSPLSSPPSSTCEQMQTSQADELAAKEKRQPSPPTQALCPMCHKEVDRASLELFKAQPKQRIREQVMFCESHKLRSAMDMWRDRGYPKIDWEGFEARVQSYFPELEKLLVPDASSYYRNILRTSFAPGKARNFRVRVDDGERLETITCGYYGAMGATKILETIIRRFSVVVRRLATTDELIKTTGVAGYTQSVLVPELAVLMVKDDMKVNDEDARRIMRESMDIGGRVNPDLNVVPIPDDVEL
ncbi:uncharacterized protein N7479_004167 [Penicillium vulpinum]|uniref:Restriction of telomere capping protein 4 n=1 Tax=Penicillium vulpinum TaxID=29845 RepID=A0A1V6SCV3_9EURO|nr:uncharacterized protein N7479_004167 [Penicillium vulpinum]KAJ5964291.1 hypothetical protein N7479_004167 [Penicillium vulpinum]OQE11423.1 hypothetical protein PENVUL_c002G02466 [Penicillium vulpinum]